MRRTSTKISPDRVHSKLPNITKSGSIVTGPPPVIVIVYSLAPLANGSETRTLAS